MVMDGEARRGPYRVLEDLHEARRKVRCFFQTIFLTSLSDWKHLGKLGSTSVGFLDRKRWTGGRSLSGSQFPYP
jgi:hypothetical protein